MDIKLGKTYKDIITKFKGIATGYCEYISGCHQVLLQPEMTDDGKYEGGKWFDIQRVVVQKAKLVQLDNTETPGCDQEAPVR